MCHDKFCLNGSIYFQTEMSACETVVVVHLMLNVLIRQVVSHVFVMRALLEMASSVPVGTSFVNKL